MSHIPHTGLTTPTMSLFTSGTRDRHVGGHVRGHVGRELILTASHNRTWGILCQRRRGLEPLVHGLVDCAPRGGGGGGGGGGQ